MSLTAHKIGAFLDFQIEHVLLLCIVSDTWDLSTWHKDGKCQIIDNIYLNYLLTNSNWLIVYLIFLTTSDCKVDAQMTIFLCPWLDILGLSKLAGNCPPEIIKARGVLKFGFGRDVLPRNLKVDPYKYQFFKKK